MYSKKERGKVFAKNVENTYLLHNFSWLTIWQGRKRK